MNFEGIERDVSFEKGDEVIILRYLVMVAFSDVRLDRVPPACVKLLKYDESVHDHVLLPLDLKLEKDIQVQAKLPSTQEEMVKYICIQLMMVTKFISGKKFFRTVSRDFLAQCMVQ